MNKAETSTLEMAKQCPPVQYVDTDRHSKSRTIIEPPKGWQLVDVRELWKYRELLFFLCWRDVKIRYKQTTLGALWAVIQPGMMMVVFTVFFGRLAGMSSGDLPYPLFTLAGLLPWTFFSTSISNGANSVVGSERLITKIYFPRLAVPFAAIGAATIDFVIAICLLGLVMLGYGHLPSQNVFLAPLIFAIIFIAALGIGTFLSALNVAYRDFRYVVPFLVQIGMFATPTIYLQPTGNETGIIKLLLYLNPMTTLVSAFRACLLGGEIQWIGVAFAALISVLLFCGGCMYFRKVEDQFADII